MQFSKSSDEYGTRRKRHKSQVSIASDEKYASDENLRVVLSLDAVDKFKRSISNFKNKTALCKASKETMREVIYFNDRTRRSHRIPLDINFISCMEIHY